MGPNKKNYVELISCFVAGCWFNNRIHELFVVCLFVVAAFCNFVLCNRSKGDDEAILQREDFFCCQLTNPESVPCRAPVWVPICTLVSQFMPSCRCSKWAPNIQNEHYISKTENNWGMSNISPPWKLGYTCLFCKVMRHVKTWFSMSSSLQAITLNPWAPT